MPIEKIRCGAMGHGDDQAACSRPSDLPRRMPDVRTYYNDDVVLLLLYVQLVVLVLLLSECV